MIFKDSLTYKQNIVAWKCLKLKQMPQFPPLKLLQPVCLETLAVQARDHLMVLPWAPQPDLRKVFPHSGEVTELLAQGPM